MTPTDDLLSVVRSLARARGFTTAAVLTFSLGVTINIAVFSIVDRLMFRALPYADPERLVQLHQGTLPAMRDSPASSSMMGEVSLAIAQRTQAFSGVAWAEGFPTPTVSAEGHAPLILTVATANILDVLGVRPIVGRGFVPSDVSNPVRSVVLTYEAWQREFGGSPDILTAPPLPGQIFKFQVIGVLPRGFILPSSRFMERCDGLFAAAGVWVNAIPGAQSVGAVARLRPGVTIAAADAEIATMMSSVGQWGSSRLQTALQAGIDRHVVVQPLRTGLSMIVGPYLWLLVGGVWVLLAIACVNLSTLLLARGRSRERDAAVRTSLGASPARLIRGAVLEAAVLCVAGSAVGVLISAAIAPLVLAVVPAEFRGFAVSPLNGRILTVTLAVSIIAAMVSAIGPAITAVRLDVIRVLHAAGRDRATSRLRGGGALLTIEAALGAVLVVGAVATIPAFLSLLYRFPGYDPRGLYNLEIPHGSGGGSSTIPPAEELAERPARVRTVLETLRGMPHVERAAASLDSLGSSVANRDLWRVDGAITDTVAISDGWFETVGAAIQAGRTFSTDELADAGQPAVLNEASVHLLWPQQPIASALGRTVSTSDGGRVIVGVIEDIHFEPGDVVRPRMYIPITAASARRRPGSQLYAIVKMANGAPLDEKAIDARLDEHFPRRQVSVSSVETAIAPVFRKPRFVAVLFGSVGSIAIVLSGLGLYAVASVEMLRRRHEMAIRLALGGTQSDLARRMLLVTLRPVALGTTLGLIAGSWVASLGEASAVGMTTPTPLPYIAAGILMLLVATLATAGPVLRTLRLDTGSVLRDA